MHNYTVLLYFSDKYKYTKLNNIENLYSLASIYTDLHIKVKVGICEIQSVFPLIFPLFSSTFYRKAFSYFLKDL